MIDNTKEYLIWTIVTFVALVAYGVILIIGTKNMTPWTDSGWALVPLAVLCGLSMACSEQWWNERKKKKEKK